MEKNVLKQFGGYFKEDKRELMFPDDDKDEIDVEDYMRETIFIENMVMKPDETKTHN